MTPLPQAAKLTGKSEYAIIQLITSGRISHYRSGGIVMVDVDEIKKKIKK